MSALPSGLFAGVNLDSILLKVWVHKNTNPIDTLHQTTVDGFLKVDDMRLEEAALKCSGSRREKMSHH